MSSRFRWWAVLVATGLALACVGGVASARIVVENGVAVGGSTLYQSALAGFAFANKSYANMPLGEKLNVSFFDSDQGSPHTFTILNISNFWIQNWSTYSEAYLGSLVHKNGFLVNATANPGETIHANFTSPAAVGYYEFVCMEPGHLQQGMWGIIAFGEAVPANISLGGGSPGPGLAVFIIIGTIVALTVLAIVLGFAIGQRKGSQHEMPPERLGYPEPLPGEQPPSPPKPPHEP